MNESTILVVDDDHLTREMTCFTLESSGYTTEVASDGNEAVAKLADVSCRMVISDWNMPGMDGLQLCRHLRQNSISGYVYTILLTSNDSTEHRVEGLGAGADDFVTKPFDCAELLARVNVGWRVLQLETREALIFSLAKLAESRDPETGSHLERVRRYSRLLAAELGKNPKYQDQVTAEFLQLIYQTSPLHDIGKVGIPDAVLLKPGRLTPAEFEVIKLHPEIGAETLRGAIELSPDATFLRMAYDITIAHHERYDGSGYPHGIAGEDIPLSARIVALADVYDALTTRRIYKPAFDHEKATSIIIESRGSHFDPDVVDAYIGTENAFRQTAQLLIDDDDHQPAIAKLAAMV